MSRYLSLGALVVAFALMAMAVSTNSLVAGSAASCACPGQCGGCELCDCTSCADCECCDFGRALCCQNPESACCLTQTPTSPAACCLPEGDCCAAESTCCPADAQRNDRS